MTISEARWLFLSSHYLLGAHHGPGTVLGSRSTCIANLCGQDHFCSPAGEGPEAHEGQDVVKGQVAYLQVGLEFQAGLFDPPLCSFLLRA